MRNRDRHSEKHEGVTCGWEKKENNQNRTGLEEKQGGESASNKKQKTRIGKALGHKEKRGGAITDGSG